MLLLDQLSQLARLRNLVGLIVRVMRGLGLLLGGIAAWEKEKLTATVICSLTACISDVLTSQLTHMHRSVTISLTHCTTHAGRKRVCLGALRREP